MSTTFKSAPYILLPGASTRSDIRGIQDVVNQLHSILSGDAGSDYGSPSEIIQYRKSTYDADIRTLNYVLEPSSYQYDGFIDRVLVKEYLDFAKSTFNAQAFVIPAEIYGVEMNYNPVTGGFKPAATVVTSPLIPVTPSTKVLLPETPPVSTFTVTYLDPAVTVTEGQDIVLRLQLNSSNHNGVTVRPEFSLYGTQFTQADVIRPNNSMFLFGEAKFAPGSSYTELRVSTIDDSAREFDESVKMTASNPNLPFQLSTEGHTLIFQGSPVVTILDNDSVVTPAATSATVNNIVTITGSNNVVNTTVTVDGRQYIEKIGTDANDSLTGTNGDDRIVGGLGFDILSGNDGNDILMGGLNADVLLGGKGDDLLSPGQGHDIMAGGVGADRFVLSKGHDTIKDFNFVEGDRILLYGENNVTYGMSEGNLVIHRAEHTTTLEGVTFATFDPTKAVLMMG